MTPTGLIESILFVSGKKVPINVLEESLSSFFSGFSVDDLVEELNARYENLKSGIRIIKIGETYQMVSAPEYYEPLKKVFGNLSEEDELSDALLETLTIIAYKQPIEKTEIDKIRGVSSGKAISALIEKGFIKPVNNQNISDKISYITTDKFLEYFGLRNLQDLPDIEYLRQTLEK